MHNDHSQNDLHNPPTLTAQAQDPGDLLLGGRSSSAQLSPWRRAKRHAERIGWPPWNRQAKRWNQVVNRLMEGEKRYLVRSKIVEDLGRSWKG